MWVVYHGMTIEYPYIFDGVCLIQLDLACQTNLHICTKELSVVFVWQEYKYTASSCIIHHISNKETDINFPHSPAKWLFAVICKLKIILLKPTVTSLYTYA